MPPIAKLSNRTVGYDFLYLRDWGTLKTFLNRGLTMHWQEYLKGDPIPWLLEEGDPDVAFLTMRDLLDIPANDPELLALKKKAYSNGAIPYLLNQMDSPGFLEKTRARIFPKYQSTVWTLILLAQLGACADMDDRIRKACNYFLDHAVNDQGQVSYKRCAIRYN